MDPLRFGDKYRIWGNKTDVDTAIRKITALNRNVENQPTKVWVGLPGTEIYADPFSTSRYSSIKTAVIFTGEEDVAEFNRMHPRWCEYEQNKAEWLERLEKLRETAESPQKADEIFDNYMRDHSGEVTIPTDLLAYVQSLRLPDDFTKIRLDQGILNATSILKAVRRGAFDAFHGTFGFRQERQKSVVSQKMTTRSQDDLTPA